MTFFSAKLENRIHAPRVEGEVGTTQGSFQFVCVLLCFFVFVFFLWGGAPDPGKVILLFIGFINRIYLLITFFFTIIFFFLLLFLLLLLFYYYYYLLLLLLLL